VRPKKFGVTASVQGSTLNTGRDSSASVPKINIARASEKELTFQVGASKKSVAIKETPKVSPKSRFFQQSNRTAEAKSDFDSSKSSSSSSTSSKAISNSVSSDSSDKAKKGQLKVAPMVRVSGVTPVYVQKSSQNLEKKIAGESLNNQKKTASFSIKSVRLVSPRKD
jgi:hypothetical protein